MLIFDSAMEHILTTLSAYHPFAQFLIFLGQNLFVFVAALLLGGMLLRNSPVPAAKTSKREWRIAAGTVLINTLVTQAGFMLWQQGLIKLDTSWTLRFFADVAILFFAMDLLMYVFHWAIHKSFLYGYIHTLHHEAIDPKPVDLFILHPAETAAFGGLWLAVIMLGTFNVWAMLVYLVLNVIFGIAGHLGNDVTPGKSDATGLLRFAGTSRFHHGHHKNVDRNFGFYTNVWDRLFGTYSEN